MSAYAWTPERRARLRERASAATGSILWPDAVLGLLDALDAAERRAAASQGNRDGLNAVLALASQPAPAPPRSYDDRQEDAWYVGWNDAMRTVLDAWKAAR